MKSFVKNLVSKVNLESFTNTSALLDVAPHNMGLDILNVIQNQVIMRIVLTYIKIFVCESNTFAMLVQTEQNSSSTIGCPTDTLV